MAQIERQLPTKEDSSALNSKRDSSAIYSRDSDNSDL